MIVNASKRFHDKKISCFETFYCHFIEKRIYIIDYSEQLNKA